MFRGPEGLPVNDVRVTRPRMISDDLSGGHQILRGYLEVSKNRYDPCRSIGFVSSYTASFAGTACEIVKKKLSPYLAYDIISDFNIEICNVLRKFIPWAIKCHIRIENRSSRLTDSPEINGGRGP